MQQLELDLTDSADKSSVEDQHSGTEFSTSGLATQSLPQNPCLIRSWYVNARGMTELSEMEVTNAEGLDAIFRAD